jgi:hypothetical protein
MQNFEVWFLFLDNEPISGSHFSSLLHILPLKHGSSLIYLSLSEIPIWTHQRQFGLTHTFMFSYKIPVLMKFLIPGLYQNCIHIYYIVLYKIDMSYSFVYFSLLLSIYAMCIACTYLCNMRVYTIVAEVLRRVLKHATLSEISLLETELSSFLRGGIIWK